MEMTVDEALQAAKRDGGCDEDCVTPELAAEVERLRVDLTCAQASYVSARDAALAAEAKLKWFEDRAMFITEAFLRREVLGASELVAWDREHPKPHDPDELDKHLARENPDGR